MSGWAIEVRKVLWIVGEPGIGKSTLARLLLGPAPYFRNSPEKWTVADRGRGAVCAAGHYGDAPGMFDGADTISYSGGKEALKWWEHNWIGGLTILDGDRLSHAGAMLHMRALDVVPFCVYLKAAPFVATERRRARGSDQNASWLKGRDTKARRFAEAFPPSQVLTPDPELTPEEIARQVQAWVSKCE